MEALRQVAIPPDAAVYFPPARGSITIRSRQPMSKPKPGVDAASIRKIPGFTCA